MDFLSFGSLNYHVICKLSLILPHSGFHCTTALIPGSLFGLMTFSHKIGLYDVQGPIPVVKNVFVPPDMEEDGLPVALEDAMPLLSFLAPVCYKNIN